MRLLTPVLLMILLLAPSTPVRADELPAAPAISAARTAGGGIVLGEDGGPRLVRQPLPGIALTRQGGFLPFGPIYSGGIALAAGDIDGDGKDDAAVSQTGVISPEVRVFGNDGTLLRSLRPYPAQGIIAILIGLLKTPSSPLPQLVTVPAEGAGGPVKVFNPLTGVELRAFNPYPDIPVQGLRVATGDVNGDGFSEIVVAPAPGAAAPVRVFNVTDGASNTLLFEFFPFGKTYQGGITVAAGDVNGDGKADIITGVETGAPLVRGLDSSQGPAKGYFINFVAARTETVDNNETITIGANVATGDLNGDGRAEILVSSVSGPPFVTGYAYFGDSVPTESFSLNFEEVKASVSAVSPNRVSVAVGDWNGDGKSDGVDVALREGNQAVVARFQIGSGAQTITPYGPAFTGGVRVATGDVNGDGFLEIVTGAGVGAGPRVKLFNALTLAEIGSFDAFEPSWQGGVFVAAGDLDGDGRAEIVVSRDAGAAPEIAVWALNNANEYTRRRSFLAFRPSFTGGVRVAVGDVNGDGRADIIGGPGPLPGNAQEVVPQFWLFDSRSGYSRVGPDIQGNAGVFVAAGDVTGDGKADIITGVGAGPSGRIQVFDLSRLTTAGVWDDTDITHVVTGNTRVAAGDFTRDGRDDIIAVPGPGITPTVMGYSYKLENVLISSFRGIDLPFQNGAFVAGLYRDSLRRTPHRLRTQLMEEEGIFYFFQTRLPGAGGVFSVTAPSNLGTFSLTLSNTLPLNPPPGVRFLPLDYQIEVGTQPSGPVSLCVPFAPELLAQHGISPETVRLFHRTAAGWEVLPILSGWPTANGPFNVLNTQACGTTTGFSPFAIGGSTQLVLPNVVKP